MLVVKTVWSQQLNGVRFTVLAARKTCCSVARMTASDNRSTVCVEKRIRLMNYERTSIAPLRATDKRRAHYFAVAFLCDCPFPHSWIIFPRAYNTASAVDEKVFCH